MLAYNLGKPDGAFAGIPGAANDAAVVLTGTSGWQSYVGVFDLSSYVSAPDTLDGYDYLTLGFTRRMRGVGAPGAIMKDICLSMPDAGGEVLWSFKAGPRDDDPKSDPDGDRMVNLYEYALGGTPTNDLDLGYRHSITNQVVGGESYIEYTYPRRIGSGTMLNYYLEMATNLLYGGWSTGGYVEMPGAPLSDSDFEWVTNRVIETDSYIRFIHLKIVETP
jgi:hypothetical protein